MTDLDILRHRLSNQHLARPRFAQPADMVAWLGAVQAQDRSHFYDPTIFKTPVARDNVPLFLPPPSGAEQRAVDAALQRYGEFLGLPVTMK